MRSVAKAMHYPPTYTPEERQNDMSSTGAGLDLMAREFGAVTGLKPYTGTGMFFEVGGTGGDVPYLSSLRPHASAQYLYKATFAKNGVGCIRVMVIQLTASSPYEILGVYFGLPAANAHSRTAVLDVTRKQLIQMQVPVTPDVERQIEASLKPVRYPA
jgi:F420-0:gamma-glutamyl ligase-like protein